MVDVAPGDYVSLTSAAVDAERLEALARCSRRAGALMGQPNEIRRRNIDGSSRIRPRHYRRADPSAAASWSCCGHTRVSRFAGLEVCCRLKMIRAGPGTAQSALPVGRIDEDDRTRQNRR